MSADGRAARPPVAFMPGFPKSATTWLYNCALSVFSAERVCRSADPALWARSSCTQRFLLPTISTNSLGDVRFMKEPFAFGGTGVKPLVADDANLVKLNGPDLRSVPSTAGLHALWLWEQTERRKDRALRAAGLRPRAHDGPRTFAAAHADQVRRIADLCEGTPSSSPLPSAWMPPATRLHNTRQPIHRACMRVSKAAPDPPGWACKWDERVYTHLNRTQSYCISSATPWLWVRERTRKRPSASHTRALTCSHTMWQAEEANATVVDFTPNYMCDADAIRRIHQSAPRPSELRFVVLIRDPIMRAFSEFSMFAYGWFWEKRGNFSAVTAASIEALRQCNSSLFRDTHELRRLSTSDLAAYLRNCFGRGQAMSYVQTSAYAVCVLHALRYFSREQFLFVRYEELVRMRTEEVLELLGRAFGLTVDDAAVRSGSRSGCEPSSSRGMVSFTGRSPVAPEDLAQATPKLEWFFEPYDKLLRELLGPEFRWERAHHTLAPIDAAEQERRRVTLASIVAKRNARIQRQKEARMQHNRAAKAFRKQQRQDQVRAAKKVERRGSTSS